MSEFLRKLAPLIVGVSALAAGTSWACTCSPVSVREAKKGADAVFAGRAEEILFVDSASEWEPRIIVRFNVARVWKGPVSRDFTMHTTYEASSCGGFARYALATGRTMLVYAYARDASGWKQNRISGSRNAESLFIPADEGAPQSVTVADDLADGQVIYTTDICSRSRQIEYAVEDFEQLGKGRDLAPLDALPDAALVESLRPRLNGAPPECRELTNAKMWRVLRNPPENSDQLVELLELGPLYSRIPKPPPVRYRQYWFDGENGSLGLCRVARGSEIVCGEAYVSFAQDAHSATWKVMSGGVSTYCDPYLQAR